MSRQENEGPKAIAPTPDAIERSRSEFDEIIFAVARVVRAAGLSGEVAADVAGALAARGWKKSRSEGRRNANSDRLALVTGYLRWWTFAVTGHAYSDRNIRHARRELVERGVVAVVADVNADGWHTTRVAVHRSVKCLEADGADAFNDRGWCETCSATLESDEERGGPLGGGFRWRFLYGLPPADVMREASKREDLHALPPVAEPSTYRERQTQEIIAMRRSGYTRPQIASIVGVSLATVRRRLQEARERGDWGIEAERPGRKPGRKETGQVIRSNGSSDPVETGQVIRSNAISHMSDQRSGSTSGSTGGQFLESGIVLSRISAADRSAAIMDVRDIAKLGLPVKAPRNRRAIAICEAMAAEGHASAAEALRELAGDPADRIT